MIQRNYRLILCLLLLVLVGASGTGVLAQADDAQLRFAHALPGASPVDVYLDGQLSAVNLELGEATHYITVPASQHLITVTATGTTTALWEQSFTPGTGKAFTLVASSVADPLTFAAFEDQREPLDAGEARFTSINAIADSEGIDVVLDDGRPLVQGQAYNAPYGTLDVPVFNYNLVVTPAGSGTESALIALDPTPLNSGTSFMLLLYGRTSNPQYTLLSAPTLPNSDTDGFLKLVHAVPGAPSVDVFVGADGAEPDTQLASLTDTSGSANSTGYIALAAGTYNVEIRTSGATSALTSGSVTVNAGEHTTAVALGSPDSITLTSLNDNIAGIGPDEALVRVTNAAGNDDTVSASLANGTIVANNLAAGASSEIVSSEPSTQSLIVSSSSAGMAVLPEQDIYGGVFYDIFALGDSIALNEANLAQGIASAPGADTATLLAAQPTLPPPTAVPAQVEPTPVPDAPVEPAQPTLAPVVVPPDAAITGRVFNLNVDANLNLRQYPDSNAFALGQVAFGTILTINGREGELEEIFISATQIPPDYVYEDPVGLLEDEDDDLNPETTWLNVTYDTPDGGTIDAWVRADFVDVRDEDGERLPLRDLDTVPGNRPGEARNTDVTPPPAPEDIVTVTVINLDPGANLNVRRTPETSGEVLAQLPLGAVAEFVGFSEDLVWAFLQYSAADGMVITGWSSMEYLQLNYNGRETDFEELDERGLVAFVDTTRRGEQTAGAPQVVAPTVDPTIDAIVAEVALDPGANLNLRRQPDVNAEVLAQIPSGTRVIVSERTADARWLLVTFENTEGWIAAQTDTAVFVVLSFNGGPQSIEDVPVTVEG